MTITWKVIPKKGFVARHWVGFDEGKSAWMITQQKTATSRRENSRTAFLRKLPFGLPKRFPTVAAAKAAAGANASSE